MVVQQHRAFRVFFADLLVPLVDTCAKEPLMHFAAKIHRSITRRNLNHSQAICMGISNMSSSTYVCEIISWMGMLSLAFGAHLYNTYHLCLWRQNIKSQSTHDLKPNRKLIYLDKKIIEKYIKITDK